MPSNESTKMESDSRDEYLDRVRTPAAIAIPPHVFEHLYLAPKNHVSGELRQTFGNPTPVALAGFILCTTPASMALLEWQGAGGFAAAANVGTYFFIGGVLLILGAIGEWILGNTFPATVFATFAGFWGTFGSIVVPWFGAYGTYSTTGVTADGLNEPQFYATFAFFLVAMAVLMVVYTIASLRTNAVLFSILLLLVPTFSCLAASFFAVAHGQASQAVTYQHAGAAQLFVVSLLGWYLFLAQILLSVEFPICLPLGDLSTIIPSRSAVRPQDVERA